MKKKKKARDNTDFYVVVAIAVIAVIGMFFFSSSEKVQKVTRIYEPQTTVEVYEDFTGEPMAKNIVGRAFRLDECLQDCQYKICKKNCGIEEGVNADCFRSCIDECNGKCIKVYGWN